MYKFPHILYYYVQHRFSEQLSVLKVWKYILNMYKTVTICSSNFACLQYFKFFTTTSGFKLKETLQSC